MDLSPKFIEPVIERTPPEEVELGLFETLDAMAIPQVAC